jgi:hypothetical protein
MFCAALAAGMLAGAGPAAAFDLVTTPYWEEAEPLPPEIDIKLYCAFYAVKRAVALNDTGSDEYRRLSKQYSTLLRAGGEALEAIGWAHEAVVEHMRRASGAEVAANFAAGTMRYSAAECDGL